jgi:tripartite-type tricarboxylate transporter receptor subunit TctC
MVAVASPKRSPSLPDIPTVAESGYPDFNVLSWWGIVAAAALPKDIITKLHAEIVKVVNLPDTQARFADQGADAATNTPEQFAAYIKSEIVKWAKLIKETGVKSE